MKALPPTTSRWRQEARRVIREALEAFGRPLARKKEKRAYLRAFYPFGPRTHLPYKAWCKEVSLAVAQDKPKPPPERMSVRTYGIDCDWCMGSGCLVCFNQRQEFAELTKRADWPNWKAALLSPERPEGIWEIFADWLEDEGFKLLAETIRWT